MEKSLLESCDQLIEDIEVMISLPGGHNSGSPFTNNDQDCNSTRMNSSGQPDFQDFEVDAPTVSSAADDQLNKFIRKSSKREEDLMDSSSDSGARRALTSWDVPKTVHADLELSQIGEGFTSTVGDVNMQRKNEPIEDIVRRRDDCKVECSFNSRGLKGFFAQEDGVRMAFTKSPSICKVDEVRLAVRHRVFVEQNVVRCVMRLIVGSGLYNDLRFHFISPGIARTEEQDICRIYSPKGLPQGQQMSMFQGASLLQKHGFYCENLNVSSRDSHDTISKENVQQSTRQENLEISLWSPSHTLCSGQNIVTVPSTNPDDIAQLFNNALHHVQQQNPSQQTLELWTESSPPTTTEDGPLTELPNDPTLKSQSNIQEYEHLQKSCRLVGPSWEGSLSTDLSDQQFHLIYSFQSSDQQLQWSSIGENSSLPSNVDVQSHRVCKLRRRNAVRFPSASHVIHLKNNRLQESRNCAQSGATRVEVCRNALAQCLHCKLQQMWDNIVQVQRELLKTWRCNVILQAELQLQRRKNRQIREARKAVYRSTLRFHSWLQSRPPLHAPR
uniref:uncharacterized protein n=1 Tax=Myxine glutinosa TaxID=7769 RepID=UPI00358E364A